MHFSIADLAEGLSLLNRYHTCAAVSFLNVENVKTMEGQSINNLVMKNLSSLAAFNKHNLFELITKCSYSQRVFFPGLL